MEGVIESSGRRAAAVNGEQDDPACPMAATLLALVEAELTAWRVTPEQAALMVGG